ncbi:MAG: DJ-1/PfpI family protein [Oscillospiraceae bacterium]|nr:DJ-1/PfpI family protein [Oscillospiraceae bacterium]
MVYVFLADGFEEIEAVAPIDILRRAGLEARSVKVGGEGKIATGSHGIKIEADMREGEIGAKEKKNPEMIVLPGGGAGVENLYKSKTLREIVSFCVESGIKIGAICAAPSILARMGFLKNIKATSYPSFLHYLSEGGAVLEEGKKVVTDGIFTTAEAAGASAEFGLELARVLKGGGEAEKIGKQILFY